MKKTLFIAALAIAALASCSENDFVGDTPSPNSNNDVGAISFAFDVPNFTRATGDAAASALGNQFIVWGEKSERASGAAAVTDGSEVHQLVFKNYIVNYAGNSAYTTTSNTKDWEYVGYIYDDATATIPTTTYSTYISPSDATTAQTIKYWDYAASNYVFTAFSAKNTDLTNGYVTVEKVTEKTTGNQVYDKGYIVELTADADATKLYFSDRQVISRADGTDRTSVNAYGGNVTLTFRNSTAQIRVGMYETIPGYSVTIDGFYYVDDANPTFATMTTANTTNFAANVPNLKTSSAATLNVTYYNEGARLNQPKISVTGSSSNYLTLGTGLFNTTLGVDATHVIYDTNIVDDPATTTVNETENGAYTTVFPQETNNKNLKLKVNYTLTAPITGETIHVYGATAEIPAEYLQWKGNYKYTYIFKINDNTNGKTRLPEGVDPGSPEGLYPITFDAVVIAAEDGLAEYITTVSEPSITTFGVDASTGKYVHDGNEYAAGSDIYATIMDGSSVVTPEEATNVNYYSIAYKVGATDADKAAFPITEASVAESIAETTNSGSHMIVATLDNNLGAPVTSVPAEDGTTITIDAVKFGNLAAGIYAIEYINTPAPFTAVPCTFVDEAAFNVATETLYTTEDCNVEATTWISSSTTYYKKVANNPGTKVYKIIKVVGD